MPNPLGFVHHRRVSAPTRPVAERLRDYAEVHLEPGDKALRVQSSRCMGCGIPFCHHGCPLHNRIPDWNALVERDRWQEALERLHRTNNFPEFTGRLCPAPCESSCVLAVNDEPVTIKEIERAIIDRGFAEGWVRPKPALARSAKAVAVVGSGPAGLAAAQQLARAGYRVVVFERDDRPGGLLRYGIPDYKLPKTMIDRRLAQMEAEGVEFRCDVTVGRTVAAAELTTEFDATCIAIGARRPRDLTIPGRELRGVHFAMDYLEQQNRRVGNRSTSASGPQISAAGKRVVILGGGDTGADCLGNALREGCAGVDQLELLPAPPATRARGNPWPEWPIIMRSSPAHEEGGQRLFGVETVAFQGGDGQVASLSLRGVAARPGAAGGLAFEPFVGTDRSLPADLVLLALGFTGPRPDDVLEEFGLPRGVGGRVVVGPGGTTGTPGVFACGDAVRGASLVVNAIAEGRTCAAAIDRQLRGSSDCAPPAAATPEVGRQPGCLPREGGEEPGLRAALAE